MAKPQRAGQSRLQAAAARLGVKRKGRTPPTDEQQPPPTSRRTTTSLNAAATAPPPPAPVYDFVLVMVVTIYSPAVIDASGALIQAEKAGRPVHGYIRGDTREGWRGFQQKVVLNGSAAAGVPLEYKDLRVTVEIPRSLYTHATPASPATERDYREVEKALLNSSERSGRIYIAWTRPPSATAHNTDPASGDVDIVEGPFAEAGRDPLTAAIAPGRLRDAQDLIEARWPACDECTRRGERGRHCYFTEVGEHFPITPKGMIEWKRWIVCSKGNEHEPPSSFFDKTSMRIRGRYRNSAAGQATAARNAAQTPPSTPSTLARTSSSTLGLGSGEVHSSDSPASHGRTALGSLSNSMNALCTGPRMTIHHYNQSYSPGNEDIVHALFKHNISYMPMLGRILARVAYQQPEELGLSPSQMDVCQEWLDGWRSLPLDANEDVAQITKDINHLRAFCSQPPLGAAIHVSAPRAANADEPLTPCPTRAT